MRAFSVWPLCITVSARLLDEFRKFYEYFMCRVCCSEGRTTTVRSPSLGLVHGQVEWHEQQSALSIRAAQRSIPQIQTYIHVHSSAGILQLSILPSRAVGLHRV